jgi:hypothetical protein
MDRLRALATAHGFFTRPDALADGYDDKAIRRALKARCWVRVRPGSYTFPDLWPEDDKGRHLVKGRAVARRFGTRVALSHTTATLEHGLALWAADLSLVHVTRTDGGAGRVECGVVHHEGLALPTDLVRVEDRLVTNPARAALETAALLPTEAGLVVLDSVLHQGKATPAELADTYALMQNWPGMQRTRLALHLADGRAESVGESRSRYLFYAQGLPAPQLQYDVFDDFGRLLGTTDFAWPEHRLLGEFDGKVKYGRLLKEGETPGEVVFREKRREDLLREQLRWGMVRLIWADLQTPRATAARVRRELSAAA